MTVPNIIDLFVTLVQLITILSALIYFLYGMPLHGSVTPTPLTKSPHEKSPREKPGKKQINYRNRVGYNLEFQNVIGRSGFILLVGPVSISQYNMYHSIEH